MGIGYRRPFARRLDAAAMSVVVGQFHHSTSSSTYPAGTRRGLTRLRVRAAVVFAASQSISPSFFHAPCAPCPRITESPRPSSTFSETGRACPGHPDPNLAVRPDLARRGPRHAALGDAINFLVLEKETGMVKHVVERRPGTVLDRHDFCNAVSRRPTRGFTNQALTFLARDRAGADVSVHP